MVNQQQVRADRTAALYDQSLQRGAALFGQYCATCHGFQGQGMAGPKLKNPDVNKFTNDDLTRIISAGIPLNVVVRRCCTCGVEPKLWAGPP